jgi:signal transduction histidine kinase
MSRRPGGAGLGLAVSRQLSRILGGDIKAVSELCKGSVFTLTAGFPAKGEANPR